jgi:hypothetical protein
MSNAGIPVIRRDLVSIEDWVGGFQRILSQVKPREPFVLSREQLEQLSKPIDLVLNSTIDPYTLKDVLIEYVKYANPETTLTEHLNKSRNPDISSKIQMALNDSSKKVFNEIFQSLTKRGLGNIYSDIYNNPDCLNLINSIVALCTGKKLDLTNSSIKDHLSKLESCRQNTFRNIAFGRLKEKFDPIDYSSDPAIEGPEQVRQVLKNAPRLAVLSVFDFIKTCLEETDDEFSKADIDLLMNLRAEIKTL